MFVTAFVSPSVRVQMIQIITIYIKTRLSYLLCLSIESKHIECEYGPKTHFDLLHIYPSHEQPHTPTHLRKQIKWCQLVSVQLMWRDKSICLRYVISVNHFSDLQSQQKSRRAKQAGMRNKDPPVCGVVLFPSNAEVRQNRTDICFAVIFFPKSLTVIICKTSWK